MSYVCMCVCDVCMHACNVCMQCMHDGVIHALDVCNTMFAMQCMHEIQCMYVCNACMNLGMHCMYRLVIYICVVVYVLHVLYCLVCNVVRACAYLNPSMECT